jgi:predicted RecA/RadA family phage recombinase
MQNYVQPGNVIKITVPAGGITSGVGILIGTHLFGVATVTAAAGASADIQVTGVVELAKTSALAIVVGDAIYWDSTNKVVNKTATAQKAIGYAVTAAANPSPTVQVRLTPNCVPNL